MREYGVFLRVADDLTQRVHGPRDEYELLRASGLIRQLLMDETPLVHRVNRSVRLPLRFAVSAANAATPLPVPGYSARWSNPDPFDLRPTTVTLEQFLAFPTIYTAGSLFTVADVVRVCAHVLGGVHFADARTAGERALVELHDSFTINDVGALTESIAGIGRVTLSGIREIYDEAARRSG